MFVLLTPSYLIRLCLSVRRSMNATRGGSSRKCILRCRVRIEHRKSSANFDAGSKRCNFTRVRSVESCRAKCRSGRPRFNFRCLYDMPIRRERTLYTVARLRRNVLAILGTFQPRSYFSYTHCNVALTSLPRFPILAVNVIA